MLIPEYQPHPECKVQNLMKNSKHFLTGVGLFVCASGYILITGNNVAYQAQQYFKEDEVLFYTGGGNIHDNDNKRGLGNIFLPDFRNERRESGERCLLTHTIAWKGIYNGEYSGESSGENPEKTDRDSTTVMTDDVPLITGSDALRLPSSWGYTLNENMSVSGYPKRLWSCAGLNIAPEAVTDDMHVTSFMQAALMINARTDNTARINRYKPDAQVYLTRAGPDTDDDFLSERDVEIKLPEKSPMGRRFAGSAVLGPPLSYWF